MQSCRTVILETPVFHIKVQVRRDATKSGTFITGTTTRSQGTAPETQARDLLDKDLKPICLTYNEGARGDHRQELKEQNEKIYKAIEGIKRDQTLQLRRITT